LSGKKKKGKKPKVSLDDSTKASDEVPALNLPEKKSKDKDKKIVLSDTEDDKQVRLFGYKPL
jgi:hypothetical protein